MDTQLATQQEQPAAPSKSVVVASERGVQLQTLGQIWKFAEMAVNSGIYKDLNDNPAVALIKIQAGLELGLTPVWALTNIFVVNGKPTVYGDALLGIVLANPLCEDVIETSEGTFPQDTYTAICEVRRKGRLPVIRKFSVADAKKANIFGKNVHALYPTRMLAMRARSWACRDAFADSLRGLGVKEEMESVTAPRQIQAREVATGLVLPDETPTHAGIDRKISEDAEKEAVDAAAKLEPSDNDGTDPKNYAKGEELFT